MWMHRKVFIKLPAFIQKNLNSCMLFFSSHLNGSKIFSAVKEFKSLLK